MSSFPSPHYDSSPTLLLSPSSLRYLASYVEPMDSLAARGGVMDDPSKRLAILTNAGRPDGLTHTDAIPWPVTQSWPGAPKPAKAPRPPSPYRQRLKLHTNPRP